MKTFFSELFGYNHHYNQKLVEIFLARQDAVGEQSIHLFDHILNAHHTWNARLQGLLPAMTIWGAHLPAEWSGIDRTNHEDSLTLLEHLDLDARVDYVSSQGQSFSNTARDILFHVINHSTYHRAQIASQWRQGGIDPLMTDYVLYKRL